MARCRQHGGTIRGMSHERRARKPPRESAARAGAARVGRTWIGRRGLAAHRRELGKSLDRHPRFGRRHLAKRFAHDVGVSPKMFARVVRLRRVLERVRSVSQPDWVALALECGYYDQSHLIGEFREITGMSPEQWVAR